MSNVIFRRNGVEFEPTKQELKIVLDDFAKQLSERDKRIAERDKRIAEIEKQIAEKKKTIEFCETYLKVKDEVRKERKTDFAIEQLERVKWIVEDIDYDFGDDNNISRDFVMKKIDKQIQELRGQK